MTKKYYAPNKVVTNKARVAFKPPVPPEPKCEIVRFVLKSAQHLDLQLDTVEELTEEFAGATRVCICGCKATGERVVFEWNNVDYLEEIESC